MKKTIAFVFIGVVACNIILAQQKTTNPKQPLVQIKSLPPQTWLGIFAGTNLNYLDYYDKITTIEGSNTGFHIGVFFKKNITEYFALQPALLFSVRGGKINNIDSTVNFRSMNAELPVNFLYLYKQLTIGMGPNFSYAINGKLKSNGSERNAYDPAESFERTLKRFEFGGNFMIGYTFKKGIFITADFSPGFSNIYKGDGSAPNNVRAKTRTFGISLGYTFGILRDE